MTRRLQAVLHDSKRDAKHEVSEMKRMKGLALWTYITLLVTAVMLAFLVQAAFGAYGEAVHNSARLNAEQVAGVVNFLAVSPPGTRHAFEMPQVDCTMEFTPRGVNMTIDARSRISHAAYFISSVPVLVDEPSSVFSCDTGFVHFVRCQARIKAASKAVNCP